MRKFNLSTISGVLQACTLIPFSLLAALFIESTYLSVVLIVCFSLIINYFILKLFLNQIQKLTAHIQQSSTSNDFWENIELNHYAEIASICEHLNAFFEKQKDFLLYTEKFAQDLLARSTASIERDTNAVAFLIEQKNETNSAASASMQLSTSTKQIVDNIQELNDLVHASYKYTQNCYEITILTKERINELSDTMDQTNKMIEDLSKHVTEISKVSSSIRDISEQTNLLALNAAIEAARAGQNGRGFAVVSDEIRALSRRTQLSTSDIDSTTRILQNSTKKTTDFIEKNVEQAYELITKAQDTTSSLDGIREAIEHITDRAALISSSVSQQAAMTDDVAGNVEKISVFASDLVGIADRARLQHIEWEKRSIDLLAMMPKSLRN